MKHSLLDGLSTASRILMRSPRSAQIIMCFGYHPTGRAPSILFYQKSQQSISVQDKLEWSRSVDATKLDQLRQMMSDPNYKQNLPSLIRTIYQFAFQTYSDLPRGPIKNNSMKKLCASTLSEIIPPEINEMINKKLEEDPSVSSHDFLTLVGMLSYF